MIIIARKPEESIPAKLLARTLRSMHVPVDFVDYENSFGHTVWSIRDLDELEETRSWSIQKRLLFLESVNRSLNESQVECAWNLLPEWAREFQKEHLEI